MRVCICNRACRVQVTRHSAVVGSQKLASLPPMPSEPVPLAANAYPRPGVCQLAYACTSSALFYPERVISTHGHCHLSRLSLSGAS